MMILTILVTCAMVFGTVQGQKIMAKAVVHLQDILQELDLPPGLPASRGVLTFEQDSPVSPVKISGTLSGLTPGKHGFHIHELGNLDAGCGSTGGHFNPGNQTHGDLFSSTRHVGDLGNIVAGKNFRSTIDIQHMEVPMTGPRSIIGRAIVVHSGEDDLGLGGDAESLRTGNAGKRVGCGVIGIAMEDSVGPSISSTSGQIPQDTLAATAVLHDARMLKTGKTPDGGRFRLGSVRFVQEAGSKLVSVVGKLQGLTPGSHGFHIHTMGNLEDGCSSSAGHYNPESKSHGARWDFDRHVGDLGNIVADENGVTNIHFKDSVINLIGQHSIIGRTLVVHLGEDDLGLGGNAGSLKTGNAGPKIACGVVGISSLNYNPVVGWSRPLIGDGPQVNRESLTEPQISPHTLPHQENLQLPERKPPRVKPRPTIEIPSPTHPIQPKPAHPKPHYVQPEELPPVHLSGTINTRGPLQPQPQSISPEQPLHYAPNIQQPQTQPSTIDRQNYYPKPAEFRHPVPRPSPVTVVHHQPVQPADIQPHSQQPREENLQYPQTAFVPDRQTPRAHGQVQSRYSGNTARRPTPAVIIHIRNRYPVPHTQPERQQRTWVSWTHQQSQYQGQSQNPNVIQPHPHRVHSQFSHSQSSQPNSQYQTVQVVRNRPSVHPSNRLREQNKIPVTAREHRPGQPITQNLVDRRNSFNNPKIGPTVQPHRSRQAFRQSSRRSQHESGFTCDPLPFQDTCSNGEPSQFTFRWFYDTVLHICTPYPWGYCRNEHEIRSHPALRSLKACERICMGR